MTTPRKPIPASAELTRQEAAGLPMPRRLGAILAVTCGVALSVLDATIANVALPNISTELHITPADSIWIVNAYQIAIIMTILAFSAIGDRWGYRRVYVGGLALFTLASVGCALSTTFAGQLAGRVIQGIGAAAVTSVNTTLIRFIYPRKMLGRGLGINATVVAVSAVAGPSVAATILSVGSWPWLFAINIPLGVVAFGLGWRFLPANPVQSHKPFSWGGAVLNALTFGMLMGSIEGFSHDLSPILIGGFIGGTLLVGTLYVCHQRRAEAPVLPLDLLRIPIFSVSVVTSICSYLAQMLALVSLPFYLQNSCGFDAMTAGWVLTAWPAVIMVIAPVAGMLVERIHAGLLCGVGLMIMACGGLLLALAPAEPTLWALMWRAAICGGGFALFQSPNNSVLIASAPAARSGSASGMQGIARLAGQTTGAALVALLFHVVPDHSAITALYLSATLAALGAVISFSRLSLPLPAGLQRR